MFLKAKKDFYTISNKLFLKAGNYYKVEPMFKANRVYGEDGDIKHQNKNFLYKVFYSLEEVRKEKIDHILNN